MKLKNERLQWIYENADELKKAAVALDFCMECGTSDGTYKIADSRLHDLAFSFLMVAMGEHIPKSLWTVDDYSVLYGIIDDSDELDVADYQ